MLRAIGGDVRLGLTLFALSTFRATNAVNASFGPGFGPYCFAGVAFFATGATSTLGVAIASGASFAASALRGVTARAFWFSSGAWGLAASLFALTGFAGCRWIGVLSDKSTSLELSRKVLPRSQTIYAR